MLVGDHQDARAGLEDRRRLGRMHQALDGAVDHEAGLRPAPPPPAPACRSPRWRRSSAPARDGDCAGVGTTTWNGRAPSRSRASSARCTLSARDCVSDRIAAVSPALHRAALEHLAERVDPLAFDAIGEHARASLGQPNSHGSLASTVGLQSAPALMVFSTTRRQSLGQNKKRRKQCISIVVSSLCRRLPLDCWASSRPSRSPQMRKPSRRMSRPSARPRSRPTPRH